MSDLRLGLVGVGGIGRAYVALTGAAEGVTLAAVADVDPAAPARAGVDAALPTFRSAAALLRADLVDAVVVCTPPATHADLAVAAAGAGVGVLCEKPLALGGADARRMIATARAAGVPLTMATKFRFVESIAEARRRVTDGAIGELIRIENTFASRVDMRARWNSDPVLSGGGVVIDNGTHSVDIARWFLGPIAEVLVNEHPRVQEVVVEDGAQVLLRAAEGATATIELSWSYDHATDTYLELYGSEGTIRIGWHGAAMRTNADPTWRSFGPAYDKLACMGAQIANFARAWRGEEPMAVSDADAVASVQVIEAAYASMASGEWTEIEPLAPVGEDVA
jgi:predicted dehydrogenase